MGLPPQKVSEGRIIIDERATLEMPHDNYYCMSLVLATGSYDYTIKFWDPSASGSTE